MAERYGFISIGQSQGGKVDSITRFEDRMLETAVRNASVFARAPLTSGSIVQDQFTIPGDWPTKYQAISLKGRASRAVMRLAPYNPTAALVEFQDVGSGSDYSGARSGAYPGYMRVSSDQADGNDRSSITFDGVFQEDPVGLTLTRVSTGESILVDAGWVNTAPRDVPISSTTPIDPPVVTGELFAVPHRCFDIGAGAGGTTTTIASNVRYGGYHDPGSVVEAALLGGSTSTLGGFTVQSYPILSFTTASGLPLGIQVDSYQYRPGQRVQFEVSGSIHPDLALAQDYWVTRVDGAGLIYVSATRGGAEVLYTGTPPGGTDYHAMALLPQHIDSTLAGCRVRFTSGALNGQEFPLTDNTRVSASPTDNFYLTVDGSIGATPAAGDTFEILPQRVNNEDVAWENFMHWVPETMLEGRTYGQQGVLTASYTAVTPGFASVFTSVWAYEGARVRLYNKFDTSVSATSAPGTITGATTLAPTSGSFTGAGQILYMVNANPSAGTFQLSTTYGGSPISDATLAAGTVAIFIDEHPDRGNPLPPGFNFDNTRVAPTSYEPYYGAEFIPRDRGASYTSSLALAMHERVGDPIHIVHCNVGGTTVARRDAWPTTTLPVTASLGEFDAASLLDWSPNIETDNCYGRLVRHLTCAKRAAAARGDTLKILGVFCLQGEADASWAEFRARYYDNQRALVKAVREKVVELGLWDGEATEIPWWQAKMPETVGTAWDGSYDNNKTVNLAIQKLADEDPYFITRATEDAVIGYDGVHYQGGYLYTLGLHAFNDWDELDVVEGGRTRLDICNQALKNLGETRTLASLLEDNASARLCKRYYGIAVQTLLERFPWSFATNTKKLTQLTNSRVDWEYAYQLPENFLGVVSLGGDPGAVYFDEELDFSIERGVLYANEGNDLYLRYTQRSPNPADYDQQFTNALSYQLAAEIAPGIAQGDKGAALSQSMAQMANYYVEQAMAYAAKNRRSVNPQDDKYAWD